MTLGEILALLGGGLTAGAINCIAGGGSLITFPLLVAPGLPGVAASVSNTLSVAPGYAAGPVGSRFRPHRPGSPATCPLRCCAGPVSPSPSPSPWSCSSRDPAPRPR